jgi:DNA-binding CsgD family transcriptional regulator
LLERAADDLLERDVELAAVTELAERALAGQGGVVFVEGPPGIGKTSLAEAALARGAAAGLAVGKARCGELERDFPFGVVRQLLEPLLAGLDSSDRDDVTSGAAGLGASVLRDPEPRTGDTPYAALHGLYWLTANLAARGPIVLAVDDAHWSDEPSLRFLAYLIKRIDAIPVLALITSRPAEAGAGRELLEGLAADPATRLVRPAALSEAAVTEIVRAGLEPDAPAGFCAACHRATGGNPFFVRELLWTLDAAGIEPSDEEAARVAEIAPETVAKSVLRRLRHLSEPALALARTVAILGNGTDPRLAAPLADLDQVTVAEAAAALAQVDLFSPSGSLEFAHPIVRAAVYTSLSPTERARGHGRAARLLVEREADADRVAAHLLATPALEEAWTVDVLRKAASAAVARGAPEVGTAYFERALAEPLSRSARADLLVDMAAAEVASLPPPAGIEHLKEALALAEEPRKRALVSLELGRAYLATLKFFEAADVLEGALSGIDTGERELRERVEGQLLTATTMALSMAPRAERRLAELSDDARAGLLTDPVLLANVAAFTACSREPAGAGAALAERALAGGELVRGRDPLPLCFAVNALIFSDRLAAARQVWTDALAEARRKGSLLMFSFASVFRSHVEWRLGSIAGAEADARAALELTEVREAQVGLPFAVSGLIDALTERGELDEAEQALVESGIAGPMPELLHVTFVLDSRARLRLAQGRAREALDDLRECARLLEGWKIRSPGRIPWRASAALALTSLGERDEAIRIALEEVELARRFEVPRELGIALRAAGLAEGGERGIELLAEAVHVLEVSPAVLEHARALTDLGAALRRGGQRSNAREPLRRALDLAHRCGATALADRAHAELVATGARPRRAVVTGLDALTASERRVAEMAAEGLMNRQIAQALFVTEKTIEWHLGQAYRKLEIGSRSELPRALATEKGEAGPPE